MAKLPRPKTAPKRIPLSWWHLNTWISSGKKGPRPKHAPKRPPAAFWLWRLYRLALAKKAGSKAWKTYLAANKKASAKTTVQKHRAAIVAHAKWGHAHSSQFHYTQGGARDDWLIAHNPNMLPQNTDCSGFSTECYYAAGVPDPNGLAYRYLGWTGTELENASKHGHVHTDLSKAEPGDIIVIGGGNGEHEFVVIEKGHDPLVASHGHEGIQVYHASADKRQPKRVCQTLPVN